MTNSLEDRIRDAFAAQAESTDIDPDAEFLDRVHGAGKTRQDGQGRNRYLIAIAAALVAVVGSAAALRSPGSGAPTPATEVDITPVSIVANPPTIVGLPFEVAAPELPVGWAFADLSEQGNSMQIESSTFLFRNQATGAVIAVDARPDAHPQNEYLDVAAGLAEGGAASYALDGKEIWFRVAGLGLEEATEIATSLILTEVDGRVDVAIEPRYGFALEWSRPTPAVPERVGGSAEITMTTPNGTATIELDSTDPSNAAWNHFGVPSTVDETVVYTADMAVTGDPIGDEVAATIRVTDARDLPAARDLYASLRRVDGTDAPGWDEIADLIANRWLALPVTARTEISDLVVTEHRDDSVTAACATWHDVTRCRSSLSSWWQDQDGVLFADVVVDGLWVVIGRIDAGETVDAPTEAPSPAVAYGVWRPTDTGAVAVYAVPSEREIVLSFDWHYGGSKAVTSWALNLSRPIR